MPDKNDDISKDAARFLADLRVEMGYEHPTPGHVPFELLEPHYTYLGADPDLSMPDRLLGAFGRLDAGRQLRLQKIVAAAAPLFLTQCAEKNSQEPWLMVAFLKLVRGIVPPALTPRFFTQLIELPVMPPTRAVWLGETVQAAGRWNISTRCNYDTWKNIVQDIAPEYVHGLAGYLSDFYFHDIAATAELGELILARLDDKAVSDELKDRGINPQVVRAKIAQLLPPAVKKGPPHHAAFDELRRDGLTVTAEWDVNQHQYKIIITDPPHHDLHIHKRRAEMLCRLMKDPGLRFLDLGFENYTHPGVAIDEDAMKLFADAIRENKTIQGIMIRTGRYHEYDFLPVFDDAVIQSSNPNLFYVEPQLSQEAVNLSFQKTAFMREVMKLMETPAKLSKGDCELIASLWPLILCMHPSKSRDGNPHRTAKLLVPAQAMCAHYGIEVEVPETYRLLARQSAKGYYDRKPFLGENVNRRAYKGSRDSALQRRDFIRRHPEFFRDDPETAPQR